MKLRAGLLLLGALVVGCGRLPQAPLVAQAIAPQAQARQAKLEAQLRPMVVRGFQQIFTTYDRQPQDAQLSFLEFGKVVTWEWFDEHDVNDDDLLTMGEWLTAGELQRQVQGIVLTGSSLVRKADRNGDGLLSQAEYLAHTAFEVDPTPWLAGPADPQVKASYFQRHANAEGLLGAESGALMVGALLAYGYYLDEADARKALAWPAPPPRF